MEFLNYMELNDEEAEFSLQVKDANLHFTKKVHDSSVFR
jgi:hypothetical protein